MGTWFFQYSLLKNEPSTYNHQHHPQTLQNLHPPNSAIRCQAKSENYTLKCPTKGTSIPDQHPFQQHVHSIIPVPLDATPLHHRDHHPDLSAYLDTPHKSGKVSQTCEDTHTIVHRHQYHNAPKKANDTNNHQQEYHQDACLPLLHT